MAQTLANAWETGRVYGAYLSGREAQFRGDFRATAEQMIVAAYGAPNKPEIRLAGFTAALRGGRVEDAGRLALVGPADTLDLRSIGQIAQAVSAWSQGRRAAANEALTLNEPSSAHRLAYRVLKAWLSTDHAARDGVLSASDEFSPALEQAVFASARARLLEIDGHYPEAEALYKSLSNASSNLSALFLPDYAAFLARRGRTDEALAAYEQAIKLGQADSETLADLDALKRSHTASPLGDLRAGAARSLTLIGAAKLTANGFEQAVDYLQMASLLDPKSERTRLILAEAIDVYGDHAYAESLLAQIKPDAPEYPQALMSRSKILSQAGDNPGALALAGELIRRQPKSIDAVVAYASLLQDMNRDAEAIKAVNAFEAANGEDALGWRGHFLRAVSRDRVKAWADAEVDMQAALKLEPDSPEILNYLGYSWIDRGLKVREGLAMVERAVALRAQPSGAFQDSLAWGYYKLGDYGRALQYGQFAVRLEPAEPEINEHLGDILWRLDRQREAEFQWRRALSLMPSAEEKQRLDDKLAHGLPALARTAA